jgi:2-keto-3-deoxy-6-phosphogluconate aldolase
VPCIGGTWIAPRALVQKESFDEIKLRAEEAQKILKMLPAKP